MYSRVDRFVNKTVLVAAPSRVLSDKCVVCFYGECLGVKTRAHWWSGARAFVYVLGRTLGCALGV